MALVGVAFAVLVGGTGIAAAQPHPSDAWGIAPQQGAEGAQPSPDPVNRGASILPFLSGAAIALGAHEGGHLLFDFAFDAAPGIRRVDFHGLPFFAITHRSDLSARREFAVSSAGFWVQHATDEWILTRRPRLKGECAPFTKGVLAFNILASVAYSGTAFARTGPFERDTRGMADSLRIDEPWIGVLILAPAILDAWRYLNPDARAPVWLSRGVKAGAVLLVLK